MPPMTTRRWRLVVERGARHDEDVATVAFGVPVPEEVADEAARALLRVWYERFGESVTVRMNWDEDPGLPPGE